MGKKSTKMNKLKYQVAREEAGLSRKDVEDQTDGMLTENRLEKIENERLKATPYDVLQMSKLYHRPDLCNHYCTNECDIGISYVPKVEYISDLPQTTLALLSSLNQIEEDKNSIINIASDGQISEDERDAFYEFNEHLNKMSLAIESLKLWAKNELSEWLLLVIIFSLSVNL